MPKMRTERVVLLTGLLLNIWDRVQARKPVRARIGGRRRFLDVSSRPTTPETMRPRCDGVGDGPESVVEKIVSQGQRATLANQRVLQTRRVAGEMRLEIDVPLTGIAISVQPGVRAFVKSTSLSCSFADRRCRVARKLLTIHPVKIAH